jgi:hypothetical protein
MDVIFAADERGFLSVEPYRSHPELELFHGRVPSTPRAREAYGSDRDFYRDLTVWVGGWDAIHERSRLTVERIGETRVGYPQLAGEARFAAGQLAHVARRLLLGERVLPFAGHLDLAQLVPSAPSRKVDHETGVELDKHHV